MNPWLRSEFAILTISYGLFTFTGLITCVIAVNSSQYPKDILFRSIEDQIVPVNRNNLAIQISCLVASGASIISIAMMNFASYGYTSLIVTSMVSRLG